MSVRPRLTTIDVMAGVAMTLVVVGHHLFQFMPRWYQLLYSAIYMFHMPLFIFISGFLIRYSYKGIHSFGEYGKYVWRKFLKFFPPYMIIGILGLLAFDNHGLDFGVLTSRILNLFIDPLSSGTSFLWYMYVLIILYAISPLIFKLNNIGLFVLFLISIPSSFYSFVFPQYICLNYLLRYLPFYVLGVIIASNFNRDNHFKPRLLVICLIVFISLLIYSLTRYNFMARLSVAYLSIPSCYLLAKSISRARIIHSALEYIGKYCFAIYILHMFFIQAFAFGVKCIGVELSTSVAVVYLFMSTFLSIYLSIISCKAMRRFGIRLI